MGTSQLRSGRGALYVKAAGKRIRILRGRAPAQFGSRLRQQQRGPRPESSVHDHYRRLQRRRRQVLLLERRCEFMGCGAWRRRRREHPAIITTDQVGVDVGFSQLGMGALIDGTPPEHRRRLHQCVRRHFRRRTHDRRSDRHRARSQPESHLEGCEHILAASARKIDPQSKPVRAAFQRYALYSPAPVG